MDGPIIYPMIWYSLLVFPPTLFLLFIGIYMIRVFRHPERFGVHYEAGQPVQSRIGGIGRALLDTLPVVKFGRQGQNSSQTPDLELQSMSSGYPNGGPRPANENEGNCGICTEDFVPQDDVRVLPCKHGFHPGCIDPWLVDRSGTCPLCRYEVRVATPPKAHLAENPRVVNV